MQSQNRGALIAGLILILFGGLFLLFNLANRLFEALDIGFSMWRLWPLILVVTGLVFFLAIALWWEDRRNQAGLAVPGTIILVNGLLLLYQSITDNWESWAWAWALEPTAVGLGLFLTYLIGQRDRGLLIGASIVGGIGLVMLVIFGSMFGGPLIGILGPLLLIGAGLALLLAGFVRPQNSE